MGRLKRDHTGYSSSGLWLKYQRPGINERSVAPKSKKDTNKWCRGKVGREHNWHRFQEMRWSWSEEDYISPYIAIHCVVCDKEKYAKTAKSANYPLHIYVKQEYCGIEPVQINVNGEYKPLTAYEFKNNNYHYCDECGYTH